MKNQKTMFKKRMSSVYLPLLCMYTCVYISKQYASHTQSQSAIIRTLLHELSNKSVN